MRFLLIIIFTLITLINNPLSAADIVKIPAFREIIWGVCHPFIIFRVKNISNRTIFVTDSLEENSILFVKSGGNLDAFKHCFWMAKLAQNIKAKKARRIGELHEKVNYRQYKRGLRRGKCVQDSTASVMDLMNNEVGISMGIMSKEIPESELIKMVIFAVNNGKLFVVRKDSNGNYIDCNGDIISNKECKWNKGRCIQKSTRLNVQ